MKFGLYISLQFNEDQDLGQAMKFLATEARTARDAGFESIWVPHHFAVHPMRMFQPHETLGRLAAEVPDLRIGTAILLLSMLSPVAVAEEAATLDWMTDGGYVLAAGLGYRPEEFQSMGVEKKHRASRFEEAVGVIRRLWAEEYVTHHGRHFHLDNIGLSVRPRDPKGCPIWVAGSVDATLKRAARIGDAWLASFTTGYDDLRGLLAAYRGLLDGQAREIPVCREGFIADSEARALDLVRDDLVKKYAAYDSWGNEEVVDRRPFAERFDAYRKDHFLLGDAAQVKDDLERYRDELGVTTILFRMNWPGMDYDASLDSIRRFAPIARALT